MSIVLELLAQIVFELLFDGLARFGWSGARALWQNVVGRTAVYSAVGTGFGLWWGDRLDGRAEWPVMLWTSLALAAVALLAGLHRWTRDRERWTGAPAERDGPWPWQWSVVPWLGIAAMNVGIAVGIAAAFDPGQ